MENSCFAGHFLIAMPGLTDPDFRGAVTYVCEHSERGALGMVVNKPTSLSMQTLFEQMEIVIKDPMLASRAVHYGGPVNSEHGFVLHRAGGQWTSSIKVGEDLALTTSKDVLEAINRGDGPQEWLLTLGYAGWGAGQLEHEIAANAWLTVPADMQMLFDTEPESMFDAALQRLGVNVFNLSGIAGHA